MALAVALARVFERFDVIVQAREDGESIAQGIQKVGPCGAGVLALNADGTLETIHEGRRAKRPDLLQTHAKRLDALFPKAPTSGQIGGGPGVA